MKVIFQSARESGVMTRINGRVAFPDRRWTKTHPLPQPGDEWEITVSGENQKQTVYFLLPDCLISTEADRTKAYEASLRAMSERYAAESAARIAADKEKYKRLAESLSAETGLPVVPAKISGLALDLSQLLHHEVVEWHWDMPAPADVMAAWENAVKLSDETETLLSQYAAKGWNVQQNGNLFVVSCPHYLVDDYHLKGFIEKTTPLNRLVREKICPKCQGLTGIVYFHSRPIPDGWHPRQDIIKRISSLFKSEKRNVEKRQGDLLCRITGGKGMTGGERNFTPRLVDRGVNIIVHRVGWAWGSSGGSYIVAEYGDNSKYPDNPVEADDAFSILDKAEALLWDALDFIFKNRNSLQPKMANWGSCFVEAYNKEYAWLYSSEYLAVRFALESGWYPEKHADVVEQILW